MLYRILKLPVLEAEMSENEQVALQSSGIQLDGRTRLYPLLGDPIIYARSPDWLSKRMTERGMNMISLPMQVPDGALDVVMHGLAATLNVDGFSLTMPHKISGYQYCTTFSEVSALLGVVAAARRNKDGTWHGHTTDGDAFVKAQIDNGAKIEGARVLVFGCGGAGSAIAISMLEQGAREVAVHDADPARSKRLVDLLSDKYGSRINTGNADPRGFDVVSNATPMGMHEGDPLPFDTTLLDPSIFVGDVVAGHGETPLIKAAKMAGCKTADGDAMVIAVLDVMCDFVSEAWN